MAVKFTPEQQRVIELHNRNILVSAAAGSGKTAVLVERIIRMVCDEEHPVDIDRLLIVTFTNAAAAEMRERIAVGIAQKLKENPESEHIQRQSALLHNAQITTIDSFSLFIVRNHFNEIGLDPAFRVADEGEIKLLRQDVMAELLEEKFAENDEKFVNCVEYFCPSGREKVLEQHILNLSAYAASFPWPAEWLMQRKKDYDAADMQELLESDYCIYLKNHVDRLVAGCVEKLKNVRRLCEEPDGPYMYGELIEQEIEMLERFGRCESLTDYEAKCTAVNFGRLPSKKDDTVSVVKRELAKEIRNEVKDTIKDISGKFFATPLMLSLSQGQAISEPVGELIDLVLEFDRRMLEKKQDKKIIDFSDMEHYALDILLDYNASDKTAKPSAVALEYRQYFEEVLIDEYQDSNLVQEYILKAVSGEEDGRYNRFMVGDVKQSIYKFRLARPELFLEKYESYDEDGECTRIDLSKNFRSRAQVVDAVNGIFERIMGRETGGIEYDDRAALYAGASYPENEGCESELILVDTASETDDESRMGADEAKRSEALAIAGKIKELRNSFKVTDKAGGELRPAKYSDMVILLRTNSGWDEEFRQVLEEEGIPAHITSKTGYFAAVEVQELLQFLRVLDNPLQDIPFFGTMKSVFGGFSEEEIALVRSENKRCSLYEALRRYCTKNHDVNSNEDSETDKGLQLLERIETYRKAMVYMPIRELLQHIVDDYGYLDYVSALPAGSKRRANVEMLFTKASDFESTSYFGLFHFIRYIEQLEKYDVDYGEADILDENADVVRIMSIHKSKGLEFPIAFVSGLSKRFNMQDVNQAMIVDMDMGLACDYVNLEKRVKNKTLRRTILSGKMREDSLSEELRVLYVALTRAKEKLIMTASLEGAAEKLEMYRARGTEKLLYTDFIEASGYLDFLLPVIDKCPVRVSVADIKTAQSGRFTEQIKLYEKKTELENAWKYADPDILDELNRRFDFVYPFESMKNLYTKTTVSELKIAAMADKDEAAFHEFEEKEIVPYIPSFKRDEEKVSGTVRGNAFHRVMELIDFDRLLGTQFADMPEDYSLYTGGLDIGALRCELDKFLAEELESLRLAKEYYDAVNTEKILNFLKSSLAFRMWRADRAGELYREQPFVLGIDADRLIEDIPKGEKVLIQGIIDAFFVEDGRIILLDYKTDVIRSMEDLHARYDTQLSYYEEALGSITGLEIKEKLLYSFYLEKCG
jgi:ATP-dependent helicase/nuclease subunit A